MTKIISIWIRRRFRLAQGITTFAAAALMCWTGAAPAQTPVISPAAQQAHAQIMSYDGPSTCIACHQQAAQEMFGSVHYQEMGATPNVPNISGTAGKGSNGAKVMNSYCGTPSTSSRATCATCHAGNGRLPSTQLSDQQLANIDCLVCHQDAYKRVPAPPYETLTMPGPTGGTHTIQVVVEDATGFQFIPDTAKMTISVLEAARTVHLPTRASCLRCHAGAGGSDGGKRGDISTVTVNPPATSDAHMSPQMADMSCANCHSEGGHRVRGRGVDLRPNDSATPLSCETCHTARPHGDYLADNAALSRDTHALRVACQTCHIPTFAKDKSTEMERNWTHAEFSLTACRGQGGWVPSEVRASNVVPTYRWFDGTSLANVLSQVPVQNAQGEYILALPNGSVQSTGAKLFPMKLHRSNSARQDSTGLLIPHSTFAYFTSGDFAAAVAEGQSLSGLSGPSSVVPVQEYQTINHGVEASANALQCGACHSAYTTGGPLRMNLRADLGYALKGTTSQVCSQCHGSKSSRGFAWDHDYHVNNRGYDCSNCHNFSRPERGLTRVLSFRPAAPGGPAAEPLSDTQVQLYWADNSSSEQGFRIERSLDGATFSSLRTVAANVTTGSDTGLTPGRSYFYRVVAYNASGDSDASMIGRATPVATAPQPVPAAPTALTATAASATQVNLSWTDNANNETGFVIERSLNNSTFSQVGSVGANVTSYSNTGLNGGTTYYYRVRAINGSGSSPFSNTASVTTPAVPTPVPAAPTALTATAASATQVNLSWTDNSNNETGFVTERSLNNSTFTQVASVGANVTSYSNTGLSGGTTYYYRVRAINGSGSSSFSNTATITTPTAPTPVPAAPSGLTASAGDGRVTLNWNASSGATSYNIKRSTTSGGPYTTIASGVTARSYVDSVVVNDTTYYYAVSAVNDSGESPNSSQVSARPLSSTPPLPPTQLRAAIGERRTIRLEWEQSVSANISYNRIYKATSSAGPFTLVATVPRTQTYSTGLSTARTYYFVVTAVNSSGLESNYSNIAASRVNNSNNNDD